MEPNASITKAATSAHGALDRAADAASETAENVARKVRPAIDRVTEKVHVAVDRAAGVAAPAADWLNAKADSMRKSPDKLLEGGRKLVTEHPWKALGAAVVLGLLLSRVLR